MRESGAGARGHVARPCPASASRKHPPGSPGYRVRGVRAIYPVSCRHLDDELDDLLVVVAAVAADHQHSVLPLGRLRGRCQDGLDEVLRIVRLGLEHGDALPQAACARLLVVEGAGLHRQDPAHFQPFYFIYEQSLLLLLLTALSSNGPLLFLSPRPCRRLRLLTARCSSQAAGPRTRTPRRAAYPGWHSPQPSPVIHSALEGITTKSLCACDTHLPQMHIAFG